MLDERTFLEFNGVMALIAAFCGVYLLSWQVRLPKKDRQKWAAIIFMCGATLFVLQLGIALVGGPALNSDWRGMATWLLWVAGFVGLAVETRRFNVPPVGHSLMRDDDRPSTT